MAFIWILLLLLLGVLMFLKPEFLWKVEHIFSVKGGEPTDFYLSAMRIGGFLMAVAAVITAIYVLI